MVPKKSISTKEPQILEMPSRKMAVVYMKGDPNKVMPQFLPALYGSVYKLKFELKKKGIEFKIDKLRARWPNAHLVPKDEWLGICGLPIPEDTTSLPQKVPDIEVKLEQWDYDTVAQSLHIGPYSEEEATVERLHKFIEENGYEIAGVHEEEYLTSPDAKVQKTIIRYPIKKK
ncbi:MAG: GyrI-like domain-containing protein [Dehalococcoidia bacterium]|nr:GyrI-like domain-containing protein [Dehalococcoidia bacterium]